MSVPPRTSVPAVQAILGRNYDQRTDLNQFIATASDIVDQVKILAFSNKGITLSPTTLELIERWLAAHSYAQFDQLYTSKSTGSASGSFQGQTGMSLDSTKYGQMAQNLDISGSLTIIGKRQFAGGFWAGSDCPPLPPTSNPLG